MDPPRHYISRAFRSPKVWIIGSMLGFIVLATAASSSNHSHYSYRIRSFSQIFMLDLEVLKKENDFGLMIGNCYCNCNWWYCNCNCNCHNETVEHDWIIPEGFSAITYHQEEMMSNESSLSDNDKDQNKQIVPAFDEQKKMEDGLNKADYNLTSQRRQVKDLELHVEDQNKKIDVLQRSLYMKENEMWKLRHELMRKDREAQLTSKKQLLDDATELITKQEEKLDELQTELGEEVHIDRKIKNIEANLEKLTMEHLSAREELKALAEKVITEKNVAELHEQNLQVMSYMNNSKEELKSQVSDVRKLIIYLREAVHRNRAKWEQRNQLKAWLLKELRKEKLDYHDAHYLPQVMESEQALKNTDISDVQNTLAAVHVYIANLKRLMKSKEQEIIEATMRLKEEENHIFTMQQELHDVEVKYYAAMSSAEKIAEWANRLVVSMKNDKNSIGMENELEMMKESPREKEMELPKEL